MKIYVKTSIMGILKQCMMGNMSIKATSGPVGTWKGNKQYSILNGDFKMSYEINKTLKASNLLNNNLFHFQLKIYFYKWKSLIIYLF